MSTRIASPDRAAETEAAILQAARDLLAEGGLEVLSMRGVAKRVGVSATTIYNYFENKRELVHRIVMQGFERFDVYLREAAARAPQGSAERVYALGEAYIRFAMENREYFKVLFTIQGEQPREMEELPESGGYYLFRQTVVEAMESGAFRRSDPDLVVIYLWAHVHGLVTLSLACNLGQHCTREEEPVGAAELFASLRDFVMRGLTPIDSHTHGDKSGDEGE